MYFSFVNLIYFSFWGGVQQIFNIIKLGNKKKKLTIDSIFLDNSQKAKQTHNYGTRNEKLQHCLINAKKR
jgi:hypothetical protein